jgi:hypothetical protein
MSEKSSIFVHPWYRIAFFIVAVFIFWTASFYLDTPNLDFDLWYLVIWPIFMVLISGYIEWSRPGKHFWIFGLNFDKTAIPNIALALSLALSFVLLFLVLSFIVFEVRIGIFGIPILYLLFYHVFVAFIEEIFLRGIILQSLAEKIGFAGAALTTSVIFAALHLLNPGIDFLSLINITLAGLVLSFMYFKTKTLWMSIAFHYFWNVGLALFLGVNLSGFRTENSLIIISEVPKNMFWGGHFGPESGLITTLFLLLMFYPIAKYGKISPYVTSKLFKRRYNESILKSY